MSTEIDVGGIPLKVERLFMVLGAIGTLIGALYGAFEVYKTYQDMQERNFYLRGTRFVWNRRKIISS